MTKYIMATVLLSLMAGAIIHHFMQPLRTEYILVEKECTVFDVPEATRDAYCRLKFN